MGTKKGCGVLFEPNFRIVRLLDHYLVGNFILISIIIEVFAFVAFYGTERIKSHVGAHFVERLVDFWVVTPFVLLTGIFPWALITIPEDEFVKDPEWLYGNGDTMIDKL